MQMRIGSSACVRQACRVPRVARGAVVQRAPVRMAPVRDVRAAFFKLGGKNGSDEAYSSSSVSARSNVWGRGGARGGPRRRDGAARAGQRAARAPPPRPLPRAAALPPRAAAAGP
jgi:hypothetical protein